MAIQCAWCGEVIFIGTPITLYSPKDPNREMPDYAKLYNAEHNAYVGCLGWDCADTGADRAGFWHPPGQVMRVMSPLEQCMQNLNDGGSGLIIVEDVDDPTEAMLD